MPIKVMDESLANKIAAGEVIEKCASVVKELVENAIDAKAKHIKVNLLEAGTKEITVIDDGLGMNEADASLAFKRHATSKLLSEDDLFRINTLGFRGEALPSIASVSDIFLKTANEKEGSEIHLKAGTITETKSSSLRRGTELSVKNLFYNVPARLKHLKSLTHELTSIIDYMHHLALTRPDISFTLSNNGKELLKTDGNGDLLKVINSIYGYDVTKKMIAFEKANDDYRISGYLSYPEINRASRKHMTTIVNQRVISNASVNKTINETYHTYKPENRYPIVVLNIETDPYLIDVNIHPTKQDVKFSKIEDLNKLIMDVFKEKLEALILIPQVESEKKHEKVLSPSFTDSFIKEDYNSTISILEEIHDISPKPNQGSFNLELKEETPVYGEKRIKELYPIGLVHGTYIICQNEDGMFLIDQHAANERINYEKYLHELAHPAKQISDLLIPFNIELPKDEFLILKERLDIIKNLGIDIEEFGLNSFVVKTSPIWFKEGYEVESINKIVELVILLDDKFSIEKFNEKLAMTLACKLSIKANENITIEEMEHLITRLRKCTNPWTCPHGRPTIIEFTNYELEKLFKRSV